MLPPVITPPRPTPAQAAGHAALEAAVAVHLDAIRRLLAEHRCDGTGPDPQAGPVPNTCHVCGQQSALDEQGRLNMHVPPGATKPVWPEMWAICRGSKIRPGEPAPAEFDLEKYRAELRQRDAPLRRRVR